jgi:nucleoside-diphosphate-sugar epimerase
MKVLITGINGFIGGSYAARLRAEGGARIVGVDLQREATGPCDEYVALDLGSPEAAAKLAALPACDRVLHAGGISGFMVETDNPRRIFDVNVAGTMAVLDMARRMACRRVVLCSTVMVYGPDPTPAEEHRETEYPRPASVYGGSKLAQEALLHAFAGQYGVDALALRFTHVYGPGRTTQCFLREMLAAGAAGRPCRIPQAATSLRQFVHIADVVESIALAMSVPTPSARVFNISADEIHTLAEAAAVVRLVAGHLDVEFDASCDLPVYRVGKLSLERAREVLGFRPRLPLADGIREYWKMFARPPGIPPTEATRAAVTPAAPPPRTSGESPRG